MTELRAAKIEVAPVKDLEREDHQDKISSLPDDILFLILEGLSMHEAARTSVLSRRWVHLFRQGSSIMMDILDFYPKNQDSELTIDDVKKSNTRLIEATKSMLIYHRLIRTLCIKFHLMEESIDIVHCVDKAMTMTNRWITSLQFVAYPEYVEDDCTLDHKIHYGRLFMRFLGAGPCAFGAVNHLHIRCVKLSIDDMASVLNACNNLEHLYLHRCHYGLESVLVIEHPRLATVTFAYCVYQTIELRWLPRLNRLTCEFWMGANQQYPLSFGYVPQLSTLILKNPATIHHKTIQLSELLSNNVMINELDLDFQSLKIWILPEAPKFVGPVLQNLQLLCLRSIHEECNLDWIMFFLEAAPLLKKLEVQMRGHPSWGQGKGNFQETIQLCEQQYQRKSDHLSWQAPDDLEHHCLKELIIYGYEVKHKFTVFIRRVLKAAVKLERVTLLNNVFQEHCMFHVQQDFQEPRSRAV